MFEALLLVLSSAHCYLEAGENDCGIDKQKPVI